MKIGAFPFVLITPALILGILLSSQISPFSNEEYYIALLILILFLIYSVHFALLKKPFIKYNNPLLVVAFVVLGYANSYLNHAINSPEVSREQLDSSQYFLARIDSKSESIGNSFRYRISVLRIRNGFSWEKINARAVLNIADTGSYSFGDEIIVKGRLQWLHKRQNPHAFDYALFLERQGIYMQAFCNTEDILITGSQKYHLRYLALRAGDFFEQILARYIHNEHELNMARAMVIGRRHEISPDMAGVYASTGTSHILAVSGLHVGIVYLIFGYILIFAKRRRRFLLYYGGILLAIWCFAFISGLSPSAKRAALMLSFILIGRAIGRKSNIYNSVFASAFCVLFFSPNLIYSVSFQFSYMAVLGIIFFYKKIYHLLYVKNKIFDFFWQITCLSFSVQLATAPISIYYFHQFPFIFPLTNLFAIPTAMLVVGGSMALFFTSFLPLLPAIIGTVMQHVMFLYNYLMYQLSKIPLASAGDLWISAHTVFFILLLIFLSSWFVFTRRVAAFKLLTLALVAYSLITLIEYYKKATDQRIVVYAVNRHFYMDIIFGRTCYSNFKITGERSAKDFQYSILPNRRYHLISSNRPIDALSNAKALGENILFVLDGKTFLVFNHPLSNLKQSEQITIDYLIIGRKGMQYLDYIRDNMLIRNIVADPTISEGDIPKIGELPATEGLHLIQRNGAFATAI